jgi:2-dehydro-3-deoxy-D-arabinonate dehydratase
MSIGLFRIESASGPRIARGPVDEGPTELLPSSVDLDWAIATGAAALDELLALPKDGEVPAGIGLLAPIAGQPVWAAGVTYKRSREARKVESTAPDNYDRVYYAKRPELFFKAGPGTARGSGQAICIREDARWNVPEPELAVVLNADGRTAALTIGNDVSSRDIEGENPLYLPQAKVYRGSCSIGPALVPMTQIEDLTDLTIRLTVDRAGQCIFDETTSTQQLHRPVGDLAAWLYRSLDFEHGCVLLTGTGIVPGEDFTLAEGDLVAIAISGLGVLRNIVEVTASRPEVRG